MIKMDFEYTTAHGAYKDALYLPDDHEYTQEQITALQTERVNNWVNVIENPPAIEPEIIEVGGVRYEKVEIDGYTVLKPVEA